MSTIYTTNVKNGFAVPQDGLSNAPFLNSLTTLMSFTFAYAPGASNIATVQLTAVDGNGAVEAGVPPFLLWLSDAATGAGLTATTASGAVAVVSTFGADFADLTAKKLKLVQPNVSGVYKLSITDTAKTGFYICALNPYTGQVVPSRQLLTADYG